MTETLLVSYIFGEGPDASLFRDVRWALMHGQMTAGLSALAEIERRYHHIGEALDRMTERYNTTTSAASTRPS